MAWHQPEHFRERFQHPMPAATVRARRRHPPTDQQRLDLFVNGSLCGGQSAGKPCLAIYWLHFQNAEAGRDPDHEVRDDLPVDNPRSGTPATSSNAATDEAAAEAGAETSPTGTDCGREASHENTYTGDAILVTTTSSAKLSSRLTTTLTDVATRLTPEGEGTRNPAEHGSAAGTTISQSAVVGRGSADHEAEVAGASLFGAAPRSSSAPTDWLSAATSSLVSPLFQNDRLGRHVEEVLMGHLAAHLSVVDKRRLQAITIMQNASPCHGCSQKYLQSLCQVLHGGKVKVHFIFASLYRLRRVSCRNLKHPHQEVPISMSGTGTD